MKIMRVKDSKLIHSFCNELNFNYKANNMHFKACYVNSYIINLYSYRTIIAQRDLEQNTTIIAKRGYSTTTSKQLSLLRHAVNTPIVVYIDALGESDEHNLNYLLNELQKLIIKDIRAISRNYKGEIDADIDNLKSFLNYFKIDKRYKEYKKAKSFLRMFYAGTLWDYVAEVEELKKINKEALLQKNKAKFKRDFKKFSFNTLEDFFFNYKDNSTIYYNYYKVYNKLLNDANVYNKNLYETLATYKSLLRLHDEDFLTTNQNIKISFTDAKKLYFYIITKKIKVGDTVLEHYRVINITNNSIQIGCHTFNIKHLERVYNKYLKGVKNDD